VASVEADFDAKTATVTMQPGKTLTRVDCETAFKSTSYGVASFEPLAAAE
jgi:hypothetical protein